MDWRGLRLAGESYWGANHMLESPHTYLVRANPYHAFPKKDAKGPQVDGLPIASLRNDFGRQVPRRAAHGPGGAHATFHLLGKAKIAQDCVPIFTDENVLRLQIAVHDIVAVQVIEALGDTCQVEQTLVRREFSSRAPPWPTSQRGAWAFSQGCPS